MGIGEAVTVLPAILVAIGVQAGASVGLWLWGRWVARRRGGQGWKLAAGVPWAALGLSVLSVCTTVVWLVRGFGAVEHIDPARKAAVLAQSISDAIHVGGVLALLAGALYLAALVAFIFGSLKAPPTSPA